MRSFRFARRSFLTAIGGAVGLRVLLDNMVAKAEGASSPPRFLMTHWPLGTVRYLFLPQGSGRSYEPSPIVQPFIDAGLRDEMTILYGLSQQAIGSGMGGSHEAGTVMMTTGHSCPGVRANGGEADDAVAGGPSFDQIFLKNVPALQTPGAGYVNAICDARVDSEEISTQCLSYGYTKRSIAGARGGTVEESTPLLPEVSPRKLYASLFSGFMPGGSTGENQEALARALKKRKSVLDFALRELDRLKALAPGSERDKIELHAEAIRKLEQGLTGQPESPVESCQPPAAPDPDIVAPRGSKFVSSGWLEPAASSDESLHAQLGKLHMAVIAAAFQCDLTRVASFQWAPGQSHVAFNGLYPGQPDVSYMHHPTSHVVTDGRLPLADTAPSGQAGDILQFLGNVQTWYNARHAELLLMLKNTQDGFGNSLLDHTVVPYVTEIACCTHQRQPLPALIFGGRALGMQHGSLLDFAAQPRCHNDLWVTVAQAYLGSDPLAKLADETFHKDGVEPIEGLWQAP